MNYLQFQVAHFPGSLQTLLRRQQDEMDQLVSALYGQGLTQSHVGEVFERLYGRHYKSSQIGPRFSRLK